MKKITLFASILSVLSFASFAQVTEHWCGINEAWSNSVKANPEYANSYQEIEKTIQSYASAQAKTGTPLKPAGTILYVPVVFHILHQGGAENISDAQVYDAVKVINEDFRKKNTDATNTIAEFAGIAVDCEIEVRLATIDPNGQCSKGIDRINTPYTSHNQDDPISSIKPNQWNPAKYLNIWVVKEIVNPKNAAGYAFLPGTTTSAKEGIVMVSTYVGSIGTGSPFQRHALSHEVGHYLGLYHTWGSSNAPETACGDDQVTDTPVTKGFLSCSTPTASKICDASKTENYQNFMEYSYCCTMYSAGQKARMLQMIGAYRSTLVSVSNNTACGVNTTPVLCGADFAVASVSNDTICPGSSVTFQDLSYNAAPTTWNWSFPTGVPTSSTMQSPTVAFNNPGSQSVSLTVGNGITSKSTTKSSAVFVGAIAGNKYSQNFETLSFPGTEFSIKNPDSGSPAWTKSTSAGFSGTSSVFIDNFSNATAAQVDVLTGLLPVNIGSITSPQLSFYISFAQKATANTDKLQLFLSSDCGETWAQRYSKGGTSLASVAPVTAAYTPASSAQWRKEVVTLSSFATKNNVMFKFVFTSGGGNNIYIDDINISSLTSIQEDGVGSSVALNVYPNPLESNTVIAFSLAEKQQVSLTLFDMLGRNVATIVSKELAPGDYTYPVAKETSGLTPGVYFVKMAMDNNTSYTQKMIIQ